MVGDIVELAQRYRDEGADELVFYDITASPDGRTVDRAWVSAVAKLLDIPFAVAGGIRSVEDAERVLSAGAEKVSVNTPALLDPELINKLAERFGSQCVVAGIDSKRAGDTWIVHQFTGSAARTGKAGRNTESWITEVVRRGAGEVVLNCMTRDGIRKGYDITQLRHMRAICKVPLIASGGAGTAQHFVEVFQQANVDGALAASVFHKGVLRIPDVKHHLHTQGIAVRP